MVAFLLAGYTLVNAMMESAAAVDETLRDVNEALRSRHHRRLFWLTLVTVTAIVLDLVVVYVNGLGAVAWQLQVLAATLTALALVGAVLFVLGIVDPDRYRRLASRIVGAPAGGRPGVETTAFLKEFDGLERDIRGLWETRAGGERLEGRTGPATLSEMTEALVRAGVLTRQVRDEIMGLVRARNLAVHGEIDFVDEGLIEAVRLLRAQLDELGGSA